MGIDARGFRYPLQPLRQQREWQLDKAMADIVSVRKRLAETQARHLELVDETAAQAGSASEHWLNRGDPATHSKLLAYLTQLQQRKVRVEGEIKVLQEELALARQEATRRQQGVEMLQRHHSELFGEYRLEQERKSTTQADQDWAARNTQPGGVQS